jgi:ATP-dependent Clp protease ATP-binding subunit ClpC
VFDRLTERACRVLDLAHREAQRFHHDYIGTEHILLGLVELRSGVATAVLEDLDVDLKKIRKEVEKRVSTGTPMVTMGQLPFTPRAKRVLELSLEEASNLGHTDIGTEHLLLGLIREGEGIAAQVLRNVEVKVEDVRTRVLAILDANPSAPSRRRETETPAPGDPVFSARSQAILRGAWVEAQRRGRRRADPEDLLLEVLRDASLSALLADAGVDAAALHERLLNALREPPSSGGMSTR